MPHLHEFSKLVLVLRSTASGTWELPVHIQTIKAMFSQVADHITYKCPAAGVSGNQGDEWFRANTPPTNGQ